MTASAKTPMWKRLVIILSAVVAGVAVPFAADLAGVSRWLGYAAGVVAALACLWGVAALLHVRLKWQGWE